MANQQAKDSASPENFQQTLAEARLGAATASGTAVDPATATADRLNAEYAAVKQRYEQQLAALDQARSHGEGTAATIRWIGLALAILGLVGLIAMRSPNSG